MKKVAELMLEPMLLNPSSLCSKINNMVLKETIVSPFVTLQNFIAAKPFKFFLETITPK